jgi:glutathione S-transferase
MLTLYDNAFSPFARKIRLALDYKGVPYDVIDGLMLANRDALEAVNGRVEVPTIVHDGLTVVNSADIVAYLERVFPDKPVYPSSHERWVRARAWERCSDATIDPILIDISLWTWAERPDSMPPGLREAARADLEPIYDALERDLRGRDFVIGDEITIADIALFPHIASVKALGVSFDAERHPSILAWLKRLRGMDLFARDIERARRYIEGGGQGAEKRKIFWRGERIEWILSRGYHTWFAREIEEGRVIWPGLGIPFTPS